MSNPVDLRKLPDNLPRPEDDGGADHLNGMKMPEIKLRSTTGEIINAGKISGRAVIYIYPMTGNPKTPLPEGWNDIPGARGCTPQSLVFNDAHAEIKQFGAEVFGLSTQDTDYQREMAERLELSFPVLSDADFALTRALNLPTMEVAGMTLLKRLTLIVKDGTIEHVFYPVFPPNEAASTVLAWLKSNSTDGDRSQHRPANSDDRGVTIYTTATCPYCKAAKVLLTSKGVSFREINVEAIEGAADEMMIRSGGRRTVPQIFVGKVHVGGLDDLQVLDDAGKLDPLLAHAT